MSAYYNITALQSVNTVLGLAEYTRDVTDGLAWVFFLLAIYIIALVSLKNYDFLDAFIVTNFGCFLIAGGLALAGLIHVIYPLALLVFTAVSLGIRFMSR